MYLKISSKKCRTSIIDIKTIKQISTHSVIVKCKTKSSLALNINSLLNMGMIVVKLSFNRIKIVGFKEIIVKP